MSAQNIEQDFPKLRSIGYEITSGETTDYNCFAWAAHETSNWWSPLPLTGYFWPEGLPRNTLVSTFVELYKRKGGFVPCENGESEKGFEKIALFGDAEGNVTHTARMTVTGKWTSKLGVMEDIEHGTLEAIEGPDYGTVIAFLKRPVLQRDD